MTETVASLPKGVEGAGAATGLEPTPATTLRVLREQAGLTVEELAGAAGFTPAFVRTIESGKLNANLFVIARLAQAIADSLRQVVPT